MDPVTLQRRQEQVPTVGDESAVVDLVTRARNGDAAAWVELVDRFVPLVWAICRRFRLQDTECDDVGQNVWLGLVEALPQLRDPAALPGWLTTTTRRECLRVVDATRRRQARELQTDADVADDERGSPEHDLLAEELDAVLRLAFARLSRRCQQLLALLMQSPPISYAEISTRLDMPVGTIGPSRSRCLDKLRRSRELAAWIEAETRRGGA
jgi:RNA polymerase sigma factor (sigma-70 family)